MSKAFDNIRTYQQFYDLQPCLKCQTAKHVRVDLCDSQSEVDLNVMIECSKCGLTIRRTVFIKDCDRDTRIAEKGYDENQQRELLLKLMRPYWNRLNAVDMTLAGLAGSTVSTFKEIFVDPGNSNT